MKFNVNLLEKILFLIDKFENDLPSKVDYLYSTDNGESSEQSHGASNCRELVYKLCCSVLGDSVKCWGVKVDPHISQLVFPFEI